MSAPCFVIICYNADAFLEPVLESIKGLAPIVAIEGPVMFHQRHGHRSSTDRTAQILHDLLPAHMIREGAWSEKDAMVNAAIPLIPKDTTHLVQVDADECWLPADLKAMFSQLDDYDSVAVKPHTFFGGFDRVMTGYELRAEWIRVQRFHEGAHWHSHRPPTILAPDGIPYRQKRHWDSPYTFFHYSYVFPKQVKEKIDYYASWNAGTIKDYFNAVYLRWVRGDVAERERVEQEYQGVHEFSVVRRGDCFTAPFAGAHPPAIQARLPQLRERFERELREVSE